MDDREPTIRSRELGEGLRRALERKDLSGKAVAKILDISQATVSRLLTGKRGANEAMVAGILAICGVTGKERDHLLDLCRDVGEPGWLQKYGSRLPKQIRTLADHEDNAIGYCQFQPLAVPGLLQTADYARAWLRRSGTVPPEEINDRVSTRMDRHRIFSKQHPADFTFVTHEWVLRTPVGGPEVMSDQLHHLLRMGVREYIEIRVIPAEVGAHAGISGPFIFMEFANIRPVVYLEGEISGLFLEESHEIRAYRHVIAKLRDVTLDEDASRELISGWQSISSRQERTTMTASEFGAIAWRKSSYSEGSNGCVEVGWRKSSYSGSNGDCVEIGWPAAGVAVRDSKQPNGPTLTFPTDTWRTFLTGRA